jgi:Protein of unknown function (DUF3575)
MKKILAFMFIFCNYLSYAQRAIHKSASNQFIKSEKYLTFNPLAIAEPQMAIGVGFGNRFTVRSAYFAELSYITKSIFYNTDVEKLNGFRFLAQYRYHFFQNGKQAKISSRRVKRKPFIALEFRLKNYDFPTTATFVNYTTFDTISRIKTNVNATSIGGAILFGTSYNISKNNKWKLEVTAGIGAKQKTIHYKNVAKGYETIRQRKRDVFGPPEIYEEVGMPYFPIAFRIKYLIN